MELHYLTWLRSRIGKEAETRDLPSGVETLAQFRDWLLRQDPAYACLKTYEDVINISVNGTVVEKPDVHRIKPDDKIIFFSPLAGG